MKRSLHALLSGVVDYAALFPPAALDMRAAVEGFATHLTEPSRFMLGRFVLPVVRLREFESAAALVRRGSHDTDEVAPWRLSALTGPDISADVRVALAFNDRHSAATGAGRLEVDSLEIKVQSGAEVAAAMSVIPAQLTPFFEVDIWTDPLDLIREIRRSGGMAKARTGGVTPDAFPSPESVARFMLTCRDERVGFKLTAGLHHPLRGEYRLTYDEIPPRGEMFGFINALVAASLAFSGASPATVVDALTATSVDAFQFTDDAISFGGCSITTEQVAAARTEFVASFGSCSFREPVDDLVTLSLY